MPDFGIFRGFNEKLFGDKLYAGQLPINLGLIGSEAFGFDADADAFFFRVTSAGGTLSTTEQLSIDTLVRQMKLDGIWTKMKAIYPMVGGGTGTTAQRQAACSQNLKSSSFTGSFSAGWTFASTGVRPNGTSAYMNTGLNPVAQSLTSADSHLSYYCRTAATTSDPAEIANFTNQSEAFALQSKSSGSLNRYFYTVASAARSVVASAPIGLIAGSSTGGNTRRDVYRNGVSVANDTTTDTAILGNYNLYLGAGNIGNISVTSYTNAQCAFASIGQGLSATNMSNLYTVVQAFNTTLSRQV